MIRKVHGLFEKLCVHVQRNMHMQFIATPVREFTRQNKFFVALFCSDSTCSSSRNCATRK